MRVLVTGVAGFIGSNTAELLLEAGHEVVGIDNHSSSLPDNVPAGIEFHEGRSGDQDLIRSLGHLDACIHFAAHIEAGESMHVPEKFFRNNVAESLQLLEVLVEQHVAKFVFSSTATVYGPEVTVPIDETHHVEPQNPYGQSKYMVEQALDWLARQGRINVARLRYFNAAGGTLSHPELHTPETHLIPILLAVAAGDREFVSLYGTDYDTPDGTCIRDYVHVKDLAAAHILALDVLNRESNLVLNLGTGAGYSNLQMIEAVERVTGQTLDVRRTERRPGDLAASVACNDKAKAVLGWELRYSDLDTLISDAWASYRTH